MLHNLSILHTVDVNLGPLDLLVGRWRTHHWTLVGRDSRTSFDNLVARGNQVLLRHHDIRESPVHHDPDLPEPFEARRHRPAKVVNELPVEEMADAIHIVLVLEDSRELPDNVFVLFFLHCDLLFEVTGSIGYLDANILGCKMSETGSRDFSAAPCGLIFDAPRMLTAAY